MMVKKSTTCSKWRGRCETGGDDEDVPLSLSMVEGEGGASGGGRGSGEFGRFISAAMILVWRASGESSESKGKLGSS